MDWELLSQARSFAISTLHLHRRGYDAQIRFAQSASIFPIERLLLRPSPAPVSFAFESTVVALDAQGLCLLSLKKVRRNGACSVPGRRVKVRGNSPDLPKNFSSPASFPVSTATINSALKDNYSRGKVADFLREKICSGCDLSIVSAYFTIYAYDELKAELDDIGHLRFLFGEPRFINALDPTRTDKKAFRLTDDGLTVANKLQQKRVARECAKWIREKVDVRSIRQAGFLHGKMYHIADGGVEEALIGSSNFTVRGLGLAKSKNNIELNLQVNDSRDRQDLKSWFNDLWNNDQLVTDVKEDVLRYLDKLYANHPPEFIYYLTLFNLFRDYIDRQDEADDTLKQIALPETGIWKALFLFQKDGARAAINKLKQFNGCILADSVGLGKTYTALAVIKYFELRNEKVLVLCPKKLRRNWTIFRPTSMLSPFKEDRFGYHVLSHTDLSREQGEADGHDLKGFNWGAYDLVVIDESHNFRNNKQARQRPGEEPRQTRYERLMGEIIRQGAKTKVLLLSATPVNNQLTDLRNQISFIAGGDVTSDWAADNTFKKDLDIDSVKETTRKAQAHFTLWAKKPAPERSTRELLKSIGGDFFKLLDGLSIARSRRQIAKYYQAEMERLGGFPRRTPPRSLHPPIDLKQLFLSFEQLNDEISVLRLALYHPTNFLRRDLPENVRNQYQDETTKGFTQEGRERILISMMKVNFLKRLESSVDSFRLTLLRTIEKIDVLEKRITSFEGHREENPEIDYDTLNPSSLDDPDNEEDEFMIGGRRRFHLGHIDLADWRKAIAHDRAQLQFLLSKTKDVKPDRDGKLAELKKLILEKLSNPTTDKDGRSNHKVLIFTAFSDTAEYLHGEIKSWLGKKIESGRGGSPHLPRKAKGQAAPSTLFIPFDPRDELQVTHQNLPHWQQHGATYFITYRLADSIPQEKLRVWKKEIDSWLATHPDPSDEAARADYHEFFARKEEWLDAGHGDCGLKQPEIRDIVVENLRHFDGDRYILDEFVVMPNHVHVIVKPIGENQLSDILHSWKSFTSKAINKSLERRGQLWMDESFDHIVRSWEQLEHYRRYVRENPTKTGLHLQSGRGGSPLKREIQGRAAPATLKRVHIALVRGDGNNKTSLGRTDYDDILTNFSPRSKRRAEQTDFPQDQQIDVLIATDCISEGQNLQDCDLLVNYDIHWNPVRIIQRFGRIDRIGSRNESVSLINFWPVADLDRYLNVKHRVEARMALVDLSATQSDNLLDPKQVEDLIEKDLLFRDRQLKKLQNEIIDLEDLDENVSLTDFSLDEFRIDLLRYLENRRDELENADTGLYAVVPAAPDIPMAQPGAIFCLRHVAGAARPDSANSQGQAAPATNINPLGAYYLIYVLDDGTVRLTFTQPKAALNLFRELAAGHASTFEELCDLFDHRTKDGSDMSHYNGLIPKALESIKQTFTKRALGGLLSGRDGKLPGAKETPKDHADAFELVTWLVILDPKSR